MGGLAALPSTDDAATSGGGVVRITAHSRTSSWGAELAARSLGDRGAVEFGMGPADDRAGPNSVAGVADANREIVGGKRGACRGQGWELEGLAT